MPSPNIRVIREQITEILGGKRFQYQWLTEKSDGTITHFSTDSTRIDTESSYTLELTMEVHRDNEATSETHRQVVFGIKGVADGNIRHDRVFLTLFNPDGSTIQQELPDVPVRLDLAHLEQQSFASLLEAGPNGLIPGWTPSLTCRLRPAAD
jgi:hypothetical protein